MEKSKYARTKEHLLAVAVGAVVLGGVTIWGWIAGNNAVLGIALGVAVAALVFAAVDLPGCYLHDKLDLLDPVEGKTRAEAEAVLGPPREIATEDDGKIVRAHWWTPAFSFTLEFRDGICRGVVYKRESPK